jgi:hypothetical protein
MDILSSIEVRWFVDDASAEAKAAKAWFHDVAPQKKREDRYLLTGRSDISFKARVEEGSQAKLETKFLLGSLGPALLHERFVGHIERWRKLSLTATDPELQAKGEWIRLAKVRRLRKLAYEEGVVRRVEVADNPVAGCGVEMTELAFELRGETRRTVTVGLQAFGPEPMLLDVLLRVCPIAFESAAGLQLGFAQSESYPAWLARTVAGQP